MSLLNKASIITTPTAYAEDYLYSIKPAYALGSELVTNGTFNTDSDWTKGTGWSISNGKAIGSNSSSSLYQATGSNYTSGKTYKIVFTVSDYVSGSVRPEITNIAGEYVTSNGTFTQYIVATSSAIGEELKGASFTGSIDNVSVKQVDPNDNWTLEAGWSYGENRLNFTTSGASNRACTSSIGITNGKTYKLSFNVLSISAGQVSLRFGGMAGVNEIIATSTGLHSGIITANSSANGNVQIEDNDNNFIGSVTNISVIEIQENGVPRLDYTNGTASILLEPQSTNLISNSENLIDGGAGWINQLGGTVVGNQFSEISGKNDAWQLNKASGTFKSLRLQQTLSSSTYTLSWYLKQGNINKAQFRFDGGLGAQYVLFDLLEGTYTDNANLDNIQINSAGGGWYRCQATITTNLTNVHLYVDDSTVSTAAGYIYAQYPQIEAQSFATSYIPTEGSTVTRAAETLNNAGNSDLFNPNEGVLYIETAALANDGTTRQISLSDGSSSPNKVSILYLSTTNEIKAFIRGGGAVSMNLSFTLNNALEFNKIALKYKVDDFALWVNGTEVLTDNSGAIPTGLSDLSFDDADGTQPFYGKCKMVAVFKEALSDTELACLTSTNNREIFLNYYYRMQYVGANTEALSCAEQTFNI